MLNPSQKKAVESQGKKIIVSAGAGSGKTRVLTERIRHLIVKRKYSSYDILALTFTRYATGEMKQRLTESLNRMPMIATFHGFCLGILRQHAENVLYQHNLDVITEIERDDILKTIAGEAGLKIHRDFEYRKRIWEMDDRLTDYNLIIRDYWQIAKQYGITDYDKIIYDTTKLIEKNTAVREYLHRQYKHVLIDEFQDTNEHLWHIIQLINPDNLFIVGDVDQCLYGFAGAKPEIMSSIGTMKNEKEWELIMLEQNYRCPVDVVVCANSLIRHNSKRIRRNLLAEKMNKGMEIKSGTRNVCK